MKKDTRYEPAVLFSNIDRTCLAFWGAVKDNKYSDDQINYEGDNKPLSRQTHIWDITELLSVGDFLDLEKWTRYKYVMDGYFAGFILNDKNELSCARSMDFAGHSELYIFLLPTPKT